jgi:hypothetical protein
MILEVIVFLETRLRHRRLQKKPLKSTKLFTDLLRADKSTITQG